MNSIFFKNILQIFQKLEVFGFENIKTEENSAKVFSGSALLATFSKNQVTIGKNLDFTNRFGENGKSSENYEQKLQSFFSFLEEKRENLIRLNHVGASILVENYDLEIEFIERNLAKTNLKIFEETSNSNDSKWMFLANEKKDHPFFEIVLSQNTAHNKPWVPHIQFDFDTNLPFDELNENVENYFGKEFFEFVLKIKNKNRLGMGIICEIEGNKIVIGLGSKERKEIFLKKVKT